MPTYDYVCTKCKKNFEAYQSMKDDAFKTCPQEHCQMKKWGKGKVERQLGTGAGLIFKGSGFYITDYRSEGYKSAEQKAQKESTASTEAKPAKEGTKTEGAKTEAKPAAPAPAPAEKKPKGRSNKE